LSDEFEAPADIFSALSALPGLGDDDDGDPGAPSEATESAEGEQPAGDAAPETASGDEPTEQTTDDGAVEPAEAPAIELPASFPAELREHLKTLPPDAQRAIAQFETERNKGVSQKLEETATLRKQLEPERQRLAQLQQVAISLAQTADPVLSEGLRRSQADWAKLANEDPAGYVQQKAAFDARLESLNTLVADQQRQAQETHRETVTREFGELVKAMPELSDPVKAKAFQTEFQSTMEAYGFTAEQIQGVVDHRMVKVARDAMKWRQSEAKRMAAAAKAAKPGVPKVVVPGKGNAAPATTRDAALLKRARNAGSVHDQADALAALFDS
jgi:hypothetical protein